MRVTVTLTGETLAWQQNGCCESSGMQQSLCTTSKDSVASTSPLARTVALPLLPANGRGNRQSLFLGVLRTLSPSAEALGETLLCRHGLSRFANVCPIVSHLFVSCVKQPDRLQKLCTLQDLCTRGAMERGLSPVPADRGESHSICQPPT